MEKIQVQKRKNYLQLLWNFLVGSFQTVEFGKTIHFKGPDNKSGNIEVGSILYGWHKTEKGELIHGKAYVEKMDGDIAIVSITGTKIK